MIKKITESDLTNEYLQQNRSHAALVAFGAGLAGAIVCVILFLMTERFLSGLQSLATEFNENQGNLTFEERIKITTEIDERAAEFFRIGTPLFLTANALWIIGAYAWTFDLRRNPSNRFVWRLGGLLVTITALACGLAWFLLIRLYLQANP